MIHKTRYVLAVQDLERSARFYRDVLGFEIRESGDSGWRFFEKDGCFIMAGECPDATPAAEIGDHSYFAYMDVDDIDELFAALVDQDVDVIKPIQSEPWGMREFGIRTVDGHRIMFGQPVDA